MTRLGQKSVYDARSREQRIRCKHLEIDKTREVRIDAHSLPIAHEGQQLYRMLRICSSTFTELISLLHSIHTLSINPSRDAHNTLSMSLITGHRLYLDSQHNVCAANQL